MVGSSIQNIYSLDGEDNSTIIETITGFYRIEGHGFFKIGSPIFKFYSILNQPELVDQIIKEVKSDKESTTLRLSSGDFVTHNIETGFLIVDKHKDVVNDQEYLDYFENGMQTLTSENNFAM